METVNVSNGSTRESLIKLQEEDHQTSRQRRKLGFIISFILLFSLILASIFSIFALLKQNIEAQSLSENPSKAITSLCSVTPFPNSCFDSIWDFHTSKRLKTKTPSQIFTISIRLAFFELKNLISGTQMQIRDTKNPKTLSSLRQCEFLFKESKVLVQKAMEVMDHHYLDVNIFKENKEIIILILQPWIWNATRNLDICINGMDDLDGKRSMSAKMQYNSREFMENSLMMLVKMDSILEMFDPSLQSILADLLLNAPEYDFTIAIFYSQYLVIFVLLFLVLRLC